MQRIGCADAFDRGDLIAVVHQGERQARVHAPAVHVNRARTALAVIAALFRAGERDGLADAIEQRGARVDVQRVILAVDAQRDGHGALRCWARRRWRRRSSCDRPGALSRWAHILRSLQPPPRWLRYEKRPPARARRRRRRRGMVRHEMLRSVGQLTRPDGILRTRISSKQRQRKKVT